MKMRTGLFGRTPALLAAVVVVAGCTVIRVGPDYDEGQTWSEANAQAAARALTSSGVSTNLTFARASLWWEQFNDPLLTNLVWQAFATNRSLLAAQCAIRQARALVGMSVATQIPQLDAKGGYTRYGTSISSSPYFANNYDLNKYQAGFDAAWEIDIFGGNSRAIESAVAGYEASVSDYASAMVSLGAEVAATYINYRTAQANWEVACSNVVIQSNTWELVSSQTRSGLVSDLPLQQATYNLEQTKAQLPLIRFELEQYANALAVLTGRTPGDLQEELASRRPIPSVASQTLCGVPAGFIRERPDVRAAERRVAQAMAEIGVAKADFYPKFALNGSIGLESLKWSKFADGGHRSLAYSFGPQFSWAIFRGGSILNNVRAKEAAHAAAFNSYEAALLTALREVRDAISGYANSEARVERLGKAVEAAHRAVTISEDLYRRGLVSFNDVLLAQRDLTSLEELLVKAQGQVAIQLVQFYKSIGGGWACRQVAPGAGAAEPVDDGALLKE